MRDAEVGEQPGGIVNLIACRAEDGHFLGAEGQAIALVVEMWRQMAKARTREARRYSALADSG